MDYYLAEIRPFAGFFPYNTVPTGWHSCDGSLLKIADHQALFSLIGTNFGGDGVSTFAVPNLNGRLPIGFGQGAGLTTNRPFATSGGSESVTLTTSQTPAHTHAFTVSKDRATSNAPSGNLYADPTPNTFYATTQTPGSPLQILKTDTVTNVGAGQPHDNRMPTIAMTYIIAIDGGLYPMKP